MKYRVLLLTLISGCGPVLTPRSDDSGESTTRDDTTGATANEAPTADASSTTSTTSTTDAATADSSGTTEPDNLFMVPPDGGPTSWECSTFHQDCPPGEKCNAWANDGGSSWNALRCVPLAPDPAEVGEPCTAEGSGVSGLDSCALGSICWGVDAETGEGSCVPYCTGALEGPSCDDPDQFCSIGSVGVLALCLPTCDPLEQSSCPQGQGCYPGGYASFVCAPDQSGDKGGLFDACEFTNGCAPGFACLTADNVGSCDVDAPRCCMPFCDLLDPTCPAGTQCFPAVQEGAVQPGDENIGLCAQDLG